MNGSIIAFGGVATLLLVVGIMYSATVWYANRLDD